MGVWVRARVSGSVMVSVSVCVNVSVRVGRRARAVPSSRQRTLVWEGAILAI